MSFEGADHEQTRCSSLVFPVPDLLYVHVCEHQLNREPRSFVIHPSMQPPQASPDISSKPSEADSVMRVTKKLVFADKAEKSNPLAV